MSLTVADLFDRGVRERVASRVFNRSIGRSVLGVRVCRDGECVVGALMHEARFSGVSSTPTSWHASGRYVEEGRGIGHERRLEVNAIFIELMRANDAGELVTTAGVRRALMLEAES